METILDWLCISLSSSDVHLKESLAYMAHLLHSNVHHL